MPIITLTIQFIAVLLQSETMMQAIDSVTNKAVSWLTSASIYENEDNLGNVDVDFWNMVQWSVVFVLLVMMIFSICSSPWVMAKIKNIRLRVPFFLTLVMGFLVYDIGMCTGEPVSLFANIPMAILHAFGMFVLSSDVSEIHEVFYYNWVFMMFFSLAHASAACISAVFIIKRFGFNIKSHRDMRKAGKQVGYTGTTYVIWGLNEVSCRLADCIKKHYGDRTTEYRLIVVRTNKDDDETESSISIDRILDFLSLPSKDIDILDSLGCLTTSTYANLMQAEISLDGSAACRDILGNELKLDLLKKVLLNSAGPIHMLFLSDDEKCNIRMVNLLGRDETIIHMADLLMKDDTISHTDAFTMKDEAAGSVGQDEENQNKESERQVIFHCLARYNSIHRVIEDKNANSNLKIKIVDSSRISVEMLKDNETILPVKFVDIESDGTVSSAFNAMVVGFSEVGEEAVHFLYEFGAFVKSGSTDDSAVRSEFHIDVIDKHMDDLAGTFISNAPAIKPSMPFIKGNENHDSLITLHKMDCRSAEFYLKLECWMKKGLNYIVIATEDDELNLSLGIRCFKLAARYRKDMEHLCILVRMHHDEDGHGQEIVDYYNRLWAAQKECEDATGKTSQSKVARDHEVCLPLQLFGQDIETFTYENVIDDTIEKEACRFKEKYEASTNPGYAMQTEMSKTKWTTDYKDKMYLTKGKKNYHPSYGEIMTLRRTRGQDFANCQHSATKRILAQKALKKAGLPEFNWSLVERPDGSPDYSLSSGNPIDPRISRILRVLGQTEHLRWNSSHEILGYIREGTDGSRNEVKMHHSCLAPWAEIKDYQIFDFGVVDVTLGIITPEKPIKK